MSPCDHSGFHSGEGRYTAATGQLRYVIVCDGCGSELRELTATDYRPNPQLTAPVAAPR